MEEQKKLAAQKALEFVKDGMIVGLGTGSTANYAIHLLAEKIKKNELKNILCVASSSSSEKLAKELSIPIISLNQLYRDKTPNIETHNPQLSIRNLQFAIRNSQLIDIYLDGADEVDKENNLIKGGGGALLREKILAQASKKFIVMIDESKISDNLGTKFYLPVEVFQFTYQSEKYFFESIGLQANLRIKNDTPFITDEGNYILDVKINPLDNPKELSDILNNRAGIVGHGIFTNDFVTEVVVGK